MSDVFAGHHSLALQQTMYAMGEAIIDQQPEIGEAPSPGSAFDPGQGSS